MGVNHHKIKPSLALALALALGATVPATAAARLELNPTTPPEPAVQIVRVAAPGGFDWGDAGIGAAGALGLSTLAIGTGLAITGSRHYAPSTANPEHGARPHQKAAGDASQRSHPKSRLVSDHQEATK